MIFNIVTTWQAIAFVYFIGLQRIVDGIVVATNFGLPTNRCFWLACNSEAFPQSKSHTH